MFPVVLRETIKKSGSRDDHVPFVDADGSIQGVGPLSSNSVQETHHTTKRASQRRVIVSCKLERLG